MTEFRYNHDLLLSDEDRKVALAAYPAVFRGLDHKELRDRFKAADQVAKRMKASSRRLGALSILLVAFALVAASTAHLTEHWHGATVWAGLATLAGLAGALIGGFGVMHSSRKKRWLLLRYESERLRQFFFQTQIVFAPEIAEAAATGDWSHFETVRGVAFSRLAHILDTEREARFDLAIREEALGVTAPDRWIVRRAGQSAIPPASSVGAEQQHREAYRDLRFLGQCSFAQDKLTETGSWISPHPADQLRAARTAAGGAILLAVLLHLVLAVAIFGGWEGAPIAWLHIAGLWLAILALAIRTLDEGLRPGAEVERYRAFRDSVRNILGRFDGARSTAKALEAMREMEELCYDEMVSFLRSNKKASFAM
ncbi:MAG: hypothetical protein QOJ27_2342 [Sphingomonadales bacterium]|nr:hypothetical protein [Sphingomonadales bacterium]